MEAYKKGNFESDVEMTDIEHLREVQQKNYFNPEPLSKQKKQKNYDEIKRRKNKNRDRD